LYSTKVITEEVSRTTPMELRLRTIFALIDNLIPMILFRSDLKNILQNSIVAKIAKSSDTDHIRGRPAGVRHPTAEE
jgi:hypothetical protein